MLVELGDGKSVNSMVGPSGGGGINLNTAVKSVESKSTLLSNVGFNVSAIKGWGIHFTKL
jgi:hypothetical protein